MEGLQFPKNLRPAFAVTSGSLRIGFGVVPFLLPRSLGVSEQAHPGLSPPPPDVLALGPSTACGQGLNTQYLLGDSYVGKGGGISLLWVTLLNLVFLMG
jgi:hypothetical protein